MDIFAPIAEEQVKNLKIGQVISVNNPRFRFADSDNIQQKIIKIIFLGEDPLLTQSYNHIYDRSKKNNGNVIKILNLLVLLENNETIIWQIRDHDIIDYFTRGLLIPRDIQVMPEPLLNQIRLPRDKENVQIVGEETRIILPVDVQNKLLSMFGHDENTDHFPKNAGRRKTAKRNSKNSKNSRKLKKIHKVKKSRKPKTIIKSRKYT